MTRRLTTLLHALRQQRENRLFFGVGRQLALLNAFVVTLIILLVGIGTLIYSRQQLDRTVTQALEERGRVAAADWISEYETGYVPDDPGFSLPPPIDDRDDPEDGTSEDVSEDLLEAGETVLFAFDTEGDLVAGPEWFIVPDLPLLSGVEVALHGQPHQEDVSVFGDFDTRTVTIPVRAQGAIIGAIQVIRGLEERDQEADVLLRATVAAMIAGLLVAVPAGLFLANRALTPIRQAFAQQRAFVADASHELRTPLAVIRANTELLQRLPNPTPEDIRVETDATLREIDSMARLVDDLLFLARGDANELGVNLNQEPIDFGETVAAAAEALRPLADKADLDLTVKTTPGIIVAICPDHAVRLVRVLLSNAIAYTPSPGRIWVQVESGRGQAILRVRDTGIGIPPEDQERVFDRFFRSAAPARQRVGQRHHLGSRDELSGTGLGLPIAKAICSAYGGEITLQSSVGIGTTVTVTLPMARSAPGERRPRPVR